jgi:uncharacterized membrane protein YtjA (UPF0391 family)
LSRRCSGLSAEIGKIFVAVIFLVIYLFTGRTAVVP